MKSLFKKIKLNNDKKNINFVKRAIHKLPETQRLIIANQMWLGTEIKNLPFALKPFKIMFEDANKNAIGKAWETLENETQNYIQVKMSNDEMDAYEKKLLKETYKDEPDKLVWLNSWFNSPDKNMKEFEETILKDIKESKAKAYKKHLEDWGIN